MNESTNIPTIEELERLKKKLEIKDADAKRDAQRKMAWFSLYGMLFYPLAIVMSAYAGLDTATATLGDIAPAYFLSVAAIVAAFYGKEAYDNKQNPTSH